MNQVERRYATTIIVDEEFRGAELVEIVSRKRWAVPSKRPRNTYSLTRLRQRGGEA